MGESSRPTRDFHEEHDTWWPLGSGPMAWRPARLGRMAQLCIECLAPSDPQCLWNKVGRRAVPGLKSWAHFFEVGIGKAGFLFSESSDNLRNPCNFTASNWIRVPKENWRRAKGNVSVKILCLCKCQLQFIVVYLHVFLSHLEGVPHLVLWCISPWSSFICAQLLRSVVVTICHSRFSSLEVPKYSCGTLEELLCDHGTQKTTCLCSGLETVHIFACKFLRCWIIWNDMSSCPIDSKGSKPPTVL